MSFWGRRAVILSASIASGAANNVQKAHCDSSSPKPLARFTPPTTSQVRNRKTSHPVRPAPTGKIDCKVPACEGIKERFERFDQMSTKENSSYEKYKRKKALERGPRSSCPLDKDEVGRATWGLLHTIAANYDFDHPIQIDRPEMDEEFRRKYRQDLKLAQEEHFTNLILGIAYLYPCEACRVEFSARVNSPEGRLGLQNAVEGGREALAKWVCEEHNEVKRRIGGRQWNCNDSEMLHKRWGENKDC